MMPKNINEVNLMKMPKKGQGMSMNVIIIAALALIVLVVLGVIFMGKASNFRKTTDTCSANGGVCTDNAVGCQTGNYEKEVSGVCFAPDGKTPDSSKVCCIKV
jgi:hypothetical protein